MKGYSQIDSLKSVFFNIPIDETRDSIYNYCIHKNIFRLIKSNYRTTRNGEVINTYYGTVQLDKKSIVKNIDSAKIQISSGGMKKDGDTIVVYILPITSYYFFSTKNSAKKFNNQVTQQLTLFTNKKPSTAKVFEDEILIGVAKYWLEPTSQIHSLNVTCKKDAESKKYCVNVNCDFYE
jgi:hypothetical protein